MSLANNFSTYVLLLSEVVSADLPIVLQTNSTNRIIFKYCILDRSRWAAKCVYSFLNSDETITWFKDLSNYDR